MDNDPAQVIDQALSEWSKRGGFGSQMVLDALAEAELAIVPVEPTEAMCDVSGTCRLGDWQAMLRAAQETGT